MRHKYTINLMQANKYFTVKELVSKDVYDLLGDEAVKLFDPKALQVLEDIREILGVPLICNNWHIGGSRQYSGYREIPCTVGVTRSAHRSGCAFDLISNHMSAEKMRNIINQNADKLSTKIRIEHGVNWLHVDIKNPYSEKIHFF